MLPLERVSLILTYVVSLGAFLSLSGMASDQFFFPLLFLFLLGLVNDFKIRVYLPRWLLNLSALLFSFFSLSQLSLENLIRPFADLLLFLLVVKAMEEKKPRDLYQMLLLSLFGIAITTTFRLDMSFLAFFLYELFLGSVAFTFINLQANLKGIPVPRELLKGYLLFSLLFPLLVAFLSVPFFFLLPRTPTPIFDLLAKREKGLVSGVAKEVEIGKVGEIQQDNTVVMRVYGNLPPDPYWRVSVFDTLLGRRWVRTVEEREQEIEPSGRTYLYTVVLEPTFDTFLPVLDYPVRPIKLEGFKGRILRLKGGFYESEEQISRPVRYSFISTPSPPKDRADPIYLDVPEDLPRSILELAGKLSKGSAGDEEKLKRVAEFFREGFSYTLKLESYGGDPLEDFLFKSKKGNCEYFASTTALLLRLMGIPSRVVGGFKGALRNDYGNYYIVTNSMAHVWVEAYVGGRWVMVDTTPPYLSPGLRKISKLDLIRDAIVSFWYENLVNFSAQKQANLLRDIFAKARSFRLSDLRPILEKTLLILLSTSALYLLLRFYTLRIKKTPGNLYRAMIRRLERLEGKNLKGMLPEEVLSVVRGKGYYGEVRFIVRLYQRHRFSKEGIGKEELLEGYRLLRRIS